MAEPISGEQLERLRRLFPEGGTITACLDGVVHQGRIDMVVEEGPCQVWSRSEVEKLVPAIRRYMVWVKWEGVRFKTWLSMEPSSELEYKGSE